MYRVKNYVRPPGATWEGVSWLVIIRICNAEFFFSNRRKIDRINENDPTLGTLVDLASKLWFQYGNI